MKKTTIIKEVIDGVDVESYEILINDTLDGFKVRISKEDRGLYTFVFYRGLESKREYRVYETFKIGSPSNQEIKETVARYLEISKTIIT